MNMNDYQDTAKSTANYPTERGLYITALGLAEKASEYSDRIQEIQIKEEKTSADHEALVNELGDVMWYLAMAAYELGVPLSSVAQRNLQRLFKQQKMRYAPKDTP